MMDMRTVVVMNIFTIIAGVIVLALLWGENRKKFEGSGYLLASFSFVTIAFLLIVARGHIPDFVSITISNGLFMSGTLMGLIGLEHFRGIRRRHYLNSILIGIGLLLCIWFTEITPDLNARTLILCIVTSIIWYQCAYLTLFNVTSSDRRGTVYTGITFAGFVVVNIVRIVYFFYDKSTGNDYLQASEFEAYILAVYQLLLILLVFSLVLMFNNKLLQEVAIQEERFHEAFHLSPFGMIITVIPGGEIRYVNKGFEEITGYNRKELTGKNSDEIGFWKEKYDRFYLMSDLLNAREVNDKEMVFYTKSGGQKVCLVSSRLLESNKEQCMLSTIHEFVKKS